MKKMLAISAVAVLGTLGFAACGDDDDDTPATTEAPVVTDAAAPTDAPVATDAAAPGTTEA